MIQYEPRDWTDVVFRLHGTVLPRIAGRVLAVAALAAGLSYFYVERGVSLAVGATAHAIVGVALGLLLVFRTNSSYDRYWEGRKSLEDVVSGCRNLARMATTYLQAAPPGVRERAIDLTAALYVCVKHYLRGEREFPELGDRLVASERARLARVQSPPLLVARWLTEVFVAETDAGRLNEQRLRTVDAAISEVVTLWGDAERILMTPVPFAYAHHIKGFLTIFCATTPLALLPSMGWYTPLASAVVAYGLFGIEEIGVEIEDPFGYDPNDLPLDEVGDLLRTDLADIAVETSEDEDGGDGEVDIAHREGGARAKVS